MRMLSAVILSFVLSTHTPVAEQTPTPTSSPEPTPSYTYITGSVSHKGVPLPSTMTVETSDGKKQVTGTSEGKQTGEWGTIPAHSFTPVAVTDETADITVSYPEGFTGDTTYDYSDLNFKGSIASLDIEAEPDTGLSVEAEHSTKGREYTIDYTITNEGTAPLTVTSNTDCGTFQVLGGAEHECSVGSRYYMKEKPLRIAGTFKGTFTYEGQEIDAVEDTAITIIDTPNADIPTSEPTPEEEVSPTQKTEAEETTSPSPLPTIVEPEPEKRNLWILLLPLSFIVAGILGLVYVVRRQNKKDEEAQESDSGTSDSETVETSDDSSSLESSRLLEEDTGFYIRPQHPEQKRP